MGKILTLIFMLAMTSCSLNLPKRTKAENISDRKYECIFRMVEKNGIDAVIAENVCEKTFRKGSK